MKRKFFAVPALCLLLGGCLDGIPDLDCNEHPEQCKMTGPPPAPAAAPQPGDDTSSLPAYPPPPTRCCPVDGPHPPECPVC